VSGWLRWDWDTADSDLVDDLAVALEVHPMRALGHYFAMVSGLGRGGEWEIGAVPGSRLERLARWDGPKGAWAEAVRARCQDGDGMLRGWWRQEKLLAKRERDRARAREAYRAAQEGVTPEEEPAPGRSDGAPPENLAKSSRDNRARKPRVSRETPAYTDDTNGTNGNSNSEGGAVAPPASTALVKKKRTAEVARNVEAVSANVAAVLGAIAVEGREAVAEQKLRRVAGEMAFLYWQHTYGHPKALLDEKRLRTVLRRLDENGGVLDEVLYALDGARKDEYVMGLGKHTQRHDAFDFILRDRSAVEAHAARMNAWRDGKPHPKAMKLAAAMRSPKEGM